MYRNLYCSFYYGYKRFNDSDPKGMALMVTALCQMLAIVTVSDFILEISHTDAKPYLNKPAGIALLAVLYFFNYLYYNENRSAIILADFRKKSKKYRNNWSTVAFLSLILPVIIVILLPQLRSRH